MSVTKQYKVSVKEVVETTHVVAMDLTDDQAVMMDEMAVENQGLVPEDRRVPDVVSSLALEGDGDVVGSYTSMWIDDVAEAQEESESARKLGPDEMTLDYVGDGEPEGLTRWDASRWVVPFVRRPALSEEWENYYIADGRMIAARRADCGAGCRCAGEFVVLP